MRLLTCHTTAPHLKGHTRTLFLFVALLFLPAAARAQARLAAASPYDGLIFSAASRYGIDLYVFHALVKQESGYQPCVTSYKGARGLMQLMPATAARFGVKNICDPAENIEGGAKYMRWLLNYFGGDYTLALAGYNAGEGAVMKYGRRVPPYAETQAYVTKILRASTLYRGAAIYPQAAVQPVAMVRQTAPPPSSVVEPLLAAPEDVQPPPKVKTASRYFWR